MQVLVEFLIGALGTVQHCVLHDLSNQATNKKPSVSQNKCIVLRYYYHLALRFSLFSSLVCLFPLFVTHSRAIWYVVSVKQKVDGSSNYCYTQSQVVFEGLSRTRCSFIGGPSCSRNTCIRGPPPAPTLGFSLSLHIEEVLQFWRRERH